MACLTAVIIDILPDALPRKSQPERSVSAPQELSLNQVREHRANGTSGIDVSHYQGTIDWQQVSKEKDVSFVYLKATESATLVDYTYRTNLNGAKRAGIPVGAYHFFSPTANVSDQLKNFLGVVKPKEQDLVPIVDVEKIGRTAPSVYVARLKEFCRGVEKQFGTKPMIYTSPNFYRKYLKGHFKEYIFMMARYADEIPEVDGDVTFVLWQYTQTGRTRGVKGNVDKSRFVDNYGLHDIML